MNDGVIYCELRACADGGGEYLQNSCFVVASIPVDLVVLGVLGLCPRQYYLVSVGYCGVKSRDLCWFRVLFVYLSYFKSTNTIRVLSIYCIY